jgi:hypothetical protein
MSLCTFLWLFNTFLIYAFTYLFLQIYKLLKASSKLEISEWFELVDGILTRRLRNFLRFGSLISLFLRISKYLRSLSTADLVLSTLSIHHYLNPLFQINGVAGVYGDTTPSCRSVWGYNSQRYSLNPFFPINDLAGVYGDTTRSCRSVWGYNSQRFDPKLSYDSAAMLIQIWCDVTGGIPCFP